MKLLNYIYEFLLGEDTDYPFEEPENRFELPAPDPITLHVITSPDAA